MSLIEAVSTLERKMIEDALRVTHGNQTSASELLGITGRMLGYRLKQYGIKNEKIGS